MSRQGYTTHDAWGPTTVDSFTPCQRGTTPLARVMTLNRGLPSATTVQASAVVLQPLDRHAICLSHLASRAGKGNPTPRPLCRDHPVPESPLPYPAVIAPCATTHAGDSQTAPWVSPAASWLRSRPCVRLTCPVSPDVGLLDVRNLTDPTPYLRAYPGKFMWTAYMPSAGPTPMDR